MKSIWGVTGVIYILAKPLQKLSNTAIIPFQNPNILTPSQWMLYVASCTFMGYVEGYKSFQKKFAPLVVKRSFTLNQSTGVKVLLAPLYCIGLFGATKKRMIVSWSLLFGISILSYSVKLLDDVSRIIIDAGVVVGLLWGIFSILLQYISTTVLHIPNEINPELPHEM